MTAHDAYVKRRVSFFSPICLFSFYVSDEKDRRIRRGKDMGQTRLGKTNRTESTRPPPRARRGSVKQIGLAAHDTCYRCRLSFCLALFVSIFASRLVFHSVCQREEEVKEYEERGKRFY